MIYFHNILTLWYQQNKRALPWRLNNSPFTVWISEIILQQTRVEQGLPYYLRFIKQFPDIRSLADASEEEVLLLWQGLGYYSRARNLHYAAKQIMKEYKGQFPETYHEIRKLKGIGDYTASAIASISFGLPNAVIDGNVYRVLSRIFGIATPIDSIKGKKEFTVLADSLLDRQNPGLYNEAMMDFGTLQCIPQKPDCSKCPFIDCCFAFKNKQIGLLPVKAKSIAQKNRYFNYFLIRHDENIYLQKREAKDIWHNLYQLPLIETEQNATEKEIISSAVFKEFFMKADPSVQSITPQIIHLLTHQKLHIRFFVINVSRPIINSNWIIIAQNEYSRFPLPKPIDRYLKTKFS